MNPLHSKLATCERWRAWMRASRWARVDLTFEEWEKAHPPLVRTFADLDRLYDWYDLKPKRPDVLVEKLV